MYIVTIKNGNITNEIHNYHQKLTSGKVTKGINSIDSFAFSLLPSNIGFNKLFDFNTLVNVYNVNKQRFEFQGRLLYSSTEMNDAGLIRKDVTCESLLGYLCDSQQLYVEEKNWTVKGFLERVISVHNSQVEAHKHFVVRTITVTDPNDNIFLGIQREDTWKTITDKLIGTLGGEIRFEVVNDVIYLDYLKEIGSTKTTEIALSKNMKAITQEKDPTAYITRLIPLGAKTSDDGEERLTVESVNNGSIYVDDDEAIEYYGVHVGYKEFDDVTEASNLLSKARKWLTENNKVQVKYSITALDLSLLGLDIDDFEVHNYYPVKNKLIGVDDTIRVIKKNIDICEEIKSSFEAGENFKTLTELQVERQKELGEAVKVVEEIKKNYITNQKLQDEQFYTSLIDQWADKIALSVSAKYVTQGILKNVEGKLELKLDEKDLVSVLNATADIINFGSSTLEIKSNRLSIESDHFTLTKDGKIKATEAEISGNITASELNHQYTRANGYGGWVNTSALGLQVYEDFSDAGNSLTTVEGNTITMRRVCPDNEVCIASIGWVGEDKEWILGVNQGTGYLGGDWKADSNLGSFSDRTLKHDIEDLDERYSAMFDSLIPVRFKYNNGTSERYHIGYIAQDVEASVLNAGMTTQDFAGVYKSNDKYLLRYGEFTALNTYEIQKLKKELKAIKEKVYG